MLEIEGSLVQYFMVSAFKQSLFLVDLQTLKIVFTLKLSEDAFSVKKVEESKVVLGGRNSIMLLHFDASRKTLSHVCSRKAHSDQVNALDWFYDQRLLVSGSADGTVALWNFDSGIARMELVGHIRLAFNPQSRPIYKVLCFAQSGYVLVANNSRQIGVLRLNFEAKSVEQLSSLGGFNSDISTICWNGRGNIFASSPSSKELLEIEMLIT